MNKIDAVNDFEAASVLKLPLGKKIIYALGQLGWSLASYGAGNLLVYFYLPPDTGGKAVFPPMIYQGYVLGMFTIIGLVFALGRVFDAVTDPLIATWSDRSKSTFGRRRLFLLVGALPFAACSFLIFFPPVKGLSPVNTMWVTAMILLLYLFMTIYVTPFFAWLAELGHTAGERLQLSTFISITWAIGFIIGSQSIALQSYFERFFEPAKAFQLVMGLFAVVSTVLMYLPVIFISEKKYCFPHASSENMMDSLKTAFSDRNFLVFTLSDFAYWCALTFIATGMVYYVTSLLKVGKEFYSLLMMIMFLLSFAFYGPVNFIAGKIGKKRLVMIAFIIFTIAFGYTTVLGMLPIPPKIQGYIIVVLAAIPLAVFGILPNAMIGDIAEAYGNRTGVYKAGIFYGARTFMSKMGQMAGALVFPSLLLIGKGSGSDIGVRLTGVAAFIFCLAGFLLIIGYDEKAIMRELKENRER
jgi:Na+/melibiose symporter-like transporter